MTWEGGSSFTVMRCRETSWVVCAPQVLFKETLLHVSTSLHGPLGAAGRFRRTDPRIRRCPLTVSPSSPPSADVSMSGLV